MTLEATGISVRAGGNELLHDVSLTVHPSEVVAIIGPNGAGKSTLLKTLCGDLTPAAGEVSLGARPLRNWTARERAKVRAVLPQDSMLTFPFTAYEVVLMGRTPHQATSDSANDIAIVREALEAVQCTNLSERIYTTLSGGERQRVHLARVLAQIWEAPAATATGDGARYLLLDEPTSNLDLAYQHGTLEIVRRFARQGVGVLVILHDLNLAAQYADRIAVLHSGCMAMSGAPAEVLQPALIERVFSIPVVVMPHPCLDCPLVVPGMASRTAEGYRPGAN